MLTQISRVAPSILINLEVAGLLGNPGKLPDAAIDAIFVAVTDLIRLSKRFNPICVGLGLSVLNEKCS